MQLSKAQEMVEENVYFLNNNIKDADIDYWLLASHLIRK